MKGKMLLKEQYQELLSEERALLWSLHNCLLKTGASPADLAHVQGAINRLDELFWIVVVGEFNSGKSAFINTLIEEKVLEEGPTPTTDRITILKYGEQRNSRVVEELRVTTFPLAFLKNVNIVDTPGTNSLMQEHDALTLDYIPKADFIVFVISADRPLTDSEREFLEIISIKWKRKVVFLLNKIDTKEPDDIRKILQYLAQEGQKILGIAPMIFPVSVRWAFTAKTTHDDALLKQSQFPDIERYLFDALNEEERVQLKLLNPMYTVQPITQAAAQELQKKLVIVTEDMNRLRHIEKQLTYTESDLKESYSRFMLKVENVLLDLRNRAFDFVEEFLQVHNVLNIRSPEKAEKQFEEKVVKNSSEQIEEILTEAADWLVKKSMKSWDDTLEYYHQELQREDRKDKIIKTTNGQFDHDRHQIYQHVVKEARAQINAFDFQQESRKILKTFQDGMLKFAATEMSAIGVGAVLVVIFQALFLDITGILASGVLVTAGFFILPRKRRQAKEAFDQRIQSLIADLTQSISARFDDYMHTTFEQIRETISPVGRFCRVEYDEITAADQEINKLISQLSAMQHRIQHILENE